jgi:predicted nucleic acid-binding protein
MVRKIVFDAYAIMTLLEDEAGAAIIHDLLVDENTEILISAINLGEVYYILLRRNGKSAAEEVIENILLEETIKIEEAQWERVKSAAEIKAGGGLSYADAFALSLAKEFQAKLVTGDPEIQAIAAKAAVEIIWLG